MRMQMPLDRLLSTGTSDGRAMIIMLDKLVRFEVFTVVTIKNAVFWDVTSCRSYVNRRFGGNPSPGMWRHVGNRAYCCVMLPYIFSLNCSFILQLILVQHLCEQLLLLPLFYDT
jgi:hypothetical protein